MLHCVTARGFRWNSKYKPEDGVILETSNIDVCEFNTHVWTSATSTSVTFNVWINVLVETSSDMLAVSGKLCITGGYNNNNNNNNNNSNEKINNNDNNNNENIMFPAHFVKY